jgi:hypothetical protein
MNQQSNTSLSYGIPDQVRLRIFLLLQDTVSESVDIESFLAQVGRSIQRRYGYLSQSSYLAARRSENPIVEHFASCGEEQFLEFLELCFQHEVLCGNQKAVDEINNIFRESWIGYYLTSFVEHNEEAEGWIVPGWKAKGYATKYEYPKAIRSSDGLIQQSLVEPTFTLLSDSRFQVANTELIRSHKAMRSGNYDDAITLAGAAFESVLKTICDINSWIYDKDRDTCRKLIEICQKNGLFPTFYLASFESVCTVRNRLGDAHGRGPVRSNTAQLEHAEHMIHLTSTNMLLLAKLAGLS